MPATPARIGFITNQFRRAIAETPSVKLRYGDLARYSEDPIETFFDSQADAQILADARQALLSPERRRFTCTATGVGEALDLDLTAGAIPLVQYVDSEREADMPALIAEIGYDFSRQTSTFTIWG